MEDDLDGMRRVVDVMRELGYNDRTAQQIEINEALALAKAGDLEGAGEAILEHLPLPPQTRRRIDAQVEG